MSYYIHQNGKVEKEAVDNLDKTSGVEDHPRWHRHNRVGPPRCAVMVEVIVYPAPDLSAGGEKGQVGYNTPPTQTTFHPLLPTPLVVPLTSFPAVHLSQYVASWLVGWLLCWLLGWFVCLLFVCLFGWLVAWLVGGLVGLTYKQTREMPKETYRPRKDTGSTHHPP